MQIVARIARISVIFCLPLVCVATGESAVFAAEKPAKVLRSSSAQSRSSTPHMAAGQSKGRTINALKKMAPGLDRPHVQASKPDRRVIPHRSRKNPAVVRPPATVQPKLDLSYHGILEHPQRYDPRLQRHNGAPHNPQASELLHDHFQELDKNHDGVLDPFERALGRLDMDRDLSNRQWD
jgi:hypothetical protein